MSKYTVTIVFRSGHVEVLQADHCAVKTTNNALTDLKLEGGTVQGLYVRLDAIDFITSEENK